MSEELKYSIEDYERFKIINIDGSLSVSNAEVFEKIISSIIERNNVIINMQSMELVTSSGLHSLINVSIDARNYDHRVLLLKPGKRFIKMLDQLHSYDYFTIIDSIEEGKLKIQYYT